MSVETRPAGVTRDGREVLYFDIVGPTGLRMEMTNYGGVITKLIVSDRNGQPVDVVLGFDTMEDYFERSPYFGALVGRYANRIDGSSFELNGRTYELEPSRDGYTLHGGPNGFDKHVFDWTVSGDSQVTLTRVSPDGEAGFPGSLKLDATYALTDDNALVLTYMAVCDADTIVNITNHSYFNLSGAGEGNVEDHVVMIAADTVCEANERVVPTGVMLDVEGTALDFRTPRNLGDQLGVDCAEIAQFGGFDHAYALSSGDGVAASAWSPKTGICMEVETCLPSIQFYTSNGMNISNAKDGRSYGRRAGLCFETQMFPDSPHHDNFPSCVLRQGEKMEQRTVYRFSVRDSAE